MPGSQRRAEFADHFRPTRTWHARYGTLLAALCFGISARAADPLPRYSFAPGREVIYRSELSLKFDGGGSVPVAVEYRTREDWAVRSLRANPDGSSRLLIRYSIHLAEIYDGKMATSPGTDPQQTELGVIDLFPDGRVVQNRPLVSGIDPAEILPRLPKNADEAKVGWEERGADALTTASATAGDGFRFTTTKRDTANKVSPNVVTARFTFDPTRGIITRAETERTQLGRRVMKGGGTIRLTGDKVLTADDLAKLTADADRYFEAVSIYEEGMKAARRNHPGPAKAALDKAVEMLRNVSDGIGNSDVKDGLLSRVKDHERRANRIVAETELRAEVVGKPAFAFALTALDGKVVKLGDLRGRIVVLDFWDRGCGWCMKAMPQMNQLVADFSDRPVTVLGINTDRDREDAEFVVKEMRLNFPTLRAGPDTVEKFGIKGFPTVVVIDREGVVRDLHGGYSPTLREEIGVAIRGLLADK